jgi:lambda repressor-like predicted transcriptional regulator
MNYMLDGQACSSYSISMNKLSRQKRVDIIRLLVEGMSLRAITRATGCSINTVTALLVTAGKACSEFQDRKFRGLICRHMQIDEIWAFSYRKEARVKTAKSPQLMLAISGPTWH